MTFTQWERRNTWPYYFLQRGGTKLDIEVGYCPVRAFSSQLLEEISLMLEQIQDSELATFYVSDRGTNRGLTELLALFGQLKNFVTHSATANKSVLVFIT